MSSVSITYISASGVSNPWIDLELKILEREGIPFELYAMRKSETAPDGDEWVRNLHTLTRPIYPLPILQFTLSILAAPFIFRGRFVAGFFNAVFGRRESLRARIACFAHFFVACHWARTLSNRNIAHIHSQWVHSCGSIGMYGAWLLGTTFSFTGHGADIWRDRVALEDKIQRAQFIVCISNFHRQFYLDHGARPEQLIMVYCGIDRARFAPRTTVSDSRDKMLRIRAHSRIVEKKGFAYLVSACEILRNRGVDFECSIAGTGPIVEDLREQVVASGLDGSVHILGERVPDRDLLDFLHQGNAYCLPCVWASDNDVDGIPAALMEAMASGLPVVSTRIAGIPDLVIDEESGLLVPSEDATALADALQRIADEDGLADHLVKGASKVIEERFNLDTCVAPLVARYRKILALP
jgi:glycosyltransferase involved in cell wall biosynthesis